MRCSRRLRNYQLETWGATSRHGSGYDLEGQAHFKRKHFNNAKYKQWKRIHPITVWTHILQPFKYQRDVVSYWINDLSDVAFVAGMLRMNWKSATTRDISNRWPWLSDRKYFFTWKIFVSPSAVTTSKSTPNSSSWTRMCSLSNSEWYKWQMTSRSSLWCPFKYTGVCFPPKEPRSQARTECSVER